MSSTDQNTSNTLFTSSPFDGIKGARWHQFEQAFKAGADAEFLGEDDESIWEACIDVDTGGNGAGAAAMPAAGAALAKAQRLHYKHPRFPAVNKRYIVVNRRLVVHQELGPASCLVYLSTAV